MRVYPASRDRALTRQAIAALRAAGHEITHDWTEGPGASDTVEARTSKARSVAMQDLAAIDRADALLLMWTPGIIAAYTEVGYALSPKKRVVVVNCPDFGPEERNIFLYLPEIEHVATLQEAIKILEAP